MKKAIIFAVLACLISMGGTTAYLVKTHKPVPVVDSLHAGKDSTAKDSAAVDTLKHIAAAKDSASRKDSTRADSAPVAARPDTGAARVPPVQAAQGPVRPAAVPTDPVAKAAAYKQVARVLSAMKPVEAAKVLGFLSDEEVEGLLRAVGPRQAADFLTNIPKERAAGLSRRLLVPRGQSR